MSQRDFTLARCDKHQSDYAVDAVTHQGMCPDCRKELPADEAPEYGWVVQTPGHVSGKPFYYDGAIWVLDHMKALRFAREADAMQAIDRCTFGIGNAVQYMWIGDQAHVVE